jgi:hypothetical protein
LPPARDGRVAAGDEYEIPGFSDREGKCLIALS